MAQDWSRTIKRDVRPFVDLPELLEKAELRVEKNGLFSGKETMPLGDLERKDLKIAVKIPALPDDMETVIGLKAGDMRLAIVVSDHRLRKSECIKVLDIDEINDEPYEFSESTMESFNWKGDVKIDLKLVLAADSGPSDGKPFLAGHWVSGKRFSLNSANENPSFPIDSWNGEAFEKRGLPADTVYYIDFYPGGLTQPLSELESALLVHIHEDVYNILSKNEGKPHIRLAEKILMNEILSDVLEQGLIELGDQDASDDGIINTLASRLGRKRGMDVKSFKAELAIRGRAGLKASIQSILGLKKSFERGGM
jgi:hypothetical protein